MTTLKEILDQAELICILETYLIKISDSKPNEAGWLMQGLAKEALMKIKIYRGKT